MSISAYLKSLFTKWRHDWNVEAAAFNVLDDNVCWETLVHDITISAQLIHGLDKGCHCNSDLYGSCCWQCFAKMLSFGGIKLLFCVWCRLFATVSLFDLQEPRILLVLPCQKPSANLVVSRRLSVHFIQPFSLASCLILSSESLLSGPVLRVWWKGVAYSVSINDDKLWISNGLMDLKGGNEYLKRKLHNPLMTDSDWTKAQQVQLQHDWPGDATRGPLWCKDLAETAAELRPRPVHQWQTIHDIVCHNLPCQVVAGYPEGIKQTEPPDALKRCFTDSNNEEVYPHRFQVSHFPGEQIQWSKGWGSRI